VSYNYEENKQTIPLYPDHKQNLQFARIKKNKNEGLQIKKVFEVPKELHI
jgi:hypothetical protein